MIGETILHYRIDGQLGQGGMGVVYRATDVKLQRTVALKFIPEGITHDSETTERFLREARAASALDHVNVGTIFGVEQAPDGRQFIVMAHYEGQTLAHLIGRGPIGTDQAVALTRQIAAGLGEAHGRGIVHRDIKPSNIILTRQGVPKIVDFGLASLAGSERLTQTGARMGTPHYMSPEQALGQAVDHRTDLWALGVILYEMLTGRCAFDASSIPVVLYRIVHEDLSLDGLDPVMQAVIRRALEKDPDERFQSARQLALALDGIEAPAEALPDPTATTMMLPPRTPDPPGEARTPPPPGGGSVRTHRWIVALATLLLVVLAGVALVRVWRAPDSSKTPAAEVSTGSGYLNALELLDRWDKGDNVERAIALLQKTVEQDPSSALGHARLAEAYRIEAALTADPEKLELALAHAQKAVDLNARLPAVQTTLGKVYSSMGETDLALAALNRAISEDAFSGDANVALARVYEKLGRLDDAETSLKKGLALEPDDWQHLNTYANFEYRQGRYTEAIEAWQRVAQLVPDNTAALTNLGAALLEAGRLAEARAACERVIELAPNPTALMNLGKILYLSGQYEQAADMFERAATVNPQDYLPVGNLAAAYAQIPAKADLAAETFARAADMAEAHAKDAATDPTVFADLAIYYAHLGRSAEARRRLSTALALGAQYAGIQAAAAEALEVLGDRSAAVDHLRKAIEGDYRRDTLRRNAALSALLDDPRASALLEGSQRAP